MKRAVLGALCAVILVATSASPTAADTPKQGGGSARDQLAARAQARADRAAPEDGFSAAETRSGGDGTGDVPFCEGDITSWSATYAANLDVSMTTACPSNPDTSLNWYPGWTDAAWYLDVNFDGEEDYAVVVLNMGEGVEAAVVRLADLVATCDGPAGYDGDRTYSASFPASCFDAPGHVRVAAEFTWDENPGGDECVCPVDDAPNGTWGPIIYAGMPPAPGAGGSGYWMLDEKGAVYAFGDARWYGNADVGAARAMDIASNPADNAGYWIVNDLGHVYGFGSSRWMGNASLPPGEQATTIVGTATGNGYYIFTNRGRAIVKGDAVHRGDVAHLALKGPVLDSTVAGGGNGYYMVACDGGVFSFSANFMGSTGHITLNKPVVGMVAYGNGYLLVASDGGIFKFADKAFRGSLGANPPAIPIKAVAPIR